MKAKYSYLFIWDYIVPDTSADIKPKNFWANDESLEVAETSFLHSLEIILMGAPLINLHYSVERSIVFTDVPEINYAEWEHSKTFKISEMDFDRLYWSTVLNDDSAFEYTRFY